MERAAYINLDAIEHNIATFKSHTAAQIMVVVKANAYGHAGSVQDIKQIVDAAFAGGATYIGVAHLEEAIALREAGVAAPILCWLHTQETPFAKAAQLDIELGISSYYELIRCVERCEKHDVVPTIHIKVDTGLGRNGVGRENWDWVFKAAAQWQKEGKLNVKALFSHFAVADEPERPESLEQLKMFDMALNHAAVYDLDFELKHLANTPGTLAFPESHFDMVRIGLGAYGLKPFDHGIDLKPAMTLTARMANWKNVPAGQGVSYGLLYHTAEETTLGLVPIGYADGIPRTTEGAFVSYRGQRYPVVGRIAMDQFVIDFHDDDLLNYAVDPADVTVDNGWDEVIIFGPEGENGPTVEEWATAAGTINYEIVTRIGPRVPRVMFRGKPQMMFGGRRES